MPLFLELGDGHPTLDEPSNTPGCLGPVLGPFIGARLLRDELRIITEHQEYPLDRVSDWVFYDGMFFSDLRIVPLENMGQARRRRVRPFDPSLTAFSNDAKV